MLRIGIAGLGFMGRRHFEIYQTLPPDQVRVTAIAEPDAKKRAGDWSDTTGNIGGPSPQQNLDGVRFHADLAGMLADPEIDLVDITLPSFLHRDAAIAAFAAGKHVICEKPLALEHRECQEMISAAAENGKQLYVGHCLRFWPAYARAVELVKEGEFGETLTARFARLSPNPKWGWYARGVDPRLSGGAALDLHIHDADFIYYLYGRPLAVTSFTGGRGGPASLDHISTVYHYGDARLITAEAGWEYATCRPFSMVFDIHMEKATLSLAENGTLTLYRDDQTPEELDVPEGDGWMYELSHFAACAAADKPSSIISAKEAAFSVRMVRAEIESAMAGGKTVALS